MDALSGDAVDMGDSLPDVDDSLVAADDWELPPGRSPIRNLA
jgi:hypothetical protein